MIPSGGNKTSLLPALSRLPTTSVRKTASETNCLAVSVLIGIKPPLAVITSRLSSNPTARTLIPKCRRLSTQKITSPTCEAIRQTATQALGSCVRVAGK